MACSVGSRKCSIEKFRRMGSRGKGKDVGEVREGKGVLTLLEEGGKGETHSEKE